MKVIYTTVIHELLTSTNIDDGNTPMKSTGNHTQKQYVKVGHVMSYMHA